MSLKSGEDTGQALHCYLFAFQMPTQKLLVFSGTVELMGMHFAQRKDTHSFMGPQKDTRNTLLVATEINLRQVPP